MLPRSYIEAMDRPTVLYILYTMVSAQQTNLLPLKYVLCEMTLFLPKKYIGYMRPLRIYCTSIILKFLWLRNHHGIYIYIYIYMRFAPQ